MKTIGTFSGLSVLLFLFINASTKPNIKKDFVKFEKNLYCSKYEVTNGDFNEFLNDIKSSPNNEYDKYNYDSTMWSKVFPQANENLYSQYHTHPAYSKYPIVNITLEAANAYCIWLTSKFNESPPRNFKKVSFRLPTEKEWMKMASALPGHNLPWMGNLPVSGVNGEVYQANVKVHDLSSGYLTYIFDGSMITSKVGRFEPNKLGIYDVIGNVSELTSEGIIKGGSWESFIEDCTIDKSQSYELPDPRVGFRILMEVVED
jgi:formylglycine-generating enzyme required for sulfatase activity